ncbi:hypothetical protein FNV43_RR17988 [Rhamnella rubrinervis]|uniref:Ubiquinone biosynthesis protein n=1 Tax=Rhamnella rubrinervis TaxID=2594499 RepID=A0A8K0E5C7_9ROSA|nr:hypothetical protein FNV43_RR17988 [Rhamnella rubrinervis]
MYRTAAKRLFLGASSGSGSSAIKRFPSLRCLSSSVNSQSFPNNIFNQHQHPHTPDYSDSTPSSSSTRSNSSTAEDARHRHSQRPRLEYQEEQSRVLGASIPHVLKLGWTEAAMIAGAKDAGVSPAIIGSFPRKEAALVEYFMDDCLQRLIDRIESGEDLKSLIPSERISKLIRFRLETQASFISKWPQALSIQAQPANVPTSFKQRAILVDEICHATGDETSEIDWYVKRTVLGGIYSTTEIYMLTDSSPDFRDTWAFLDGRVKDAFDLKKSVLEAKYLAETVGAGMGSSLQGFVKRAFQG